MLRHPRSDAIARWMREAGIETTALEGSVRGGRGAVRGGRMMIERVAPASVPGFFDAMAAPLHPAAEALARAAEALGLPAIVGWDRLVTKVYANASDASAGVRARLAAAMEIDPSSAPHVIGLNIASGTLEVKVYAQSARPPEHVVAAALEALVPPALIAGWVTSHTLPGGLRAVFAALKAGHPDGLDALPGFSRAAVGSVAPFPLGPIKSVGLDAADPRRWTVYFKPPHAAPDSWSLEPVLVVRDARSEVGLFVEPASLGRRAFSRVGPHALSYRVRAGSPDRANVDALMRWAGERVRAGADPHSLAAPPEPWHVVDVP